MDDLPLSRIAALVPEFAVTDLPLGRTLMMIVHFFLRTIYSRMLKFLRVIYESFDCNLTQEFSDS